MRFKNSEGRSEERRCTGYRDIGRGTLEEGYSRAGAAAMVQNKSARGWPVQKAGQVRTQAQTRLVLHHVTALPTLLLGVSPRSGRGSARRVVQRRQVPQSYASAVAGRLIDVHKELSQHSPRWGWVCGSTAQLAAAQERYCVQ